MREADLILDLAAAASTAIHFNDLGLGKFSVKISPKRIIRKVGVPHNRIRILQHHFLSMTKPI